MAEKRAVEILDLYEREWQNSQNYLNLCQETAEFVYPLEDQITRSDTSYQPRTQQIVDTTAIFAAQDMASGLSALLFPPGQQNFSIKSTSREINENDSVNSYFSVLTEAVHDKLFSSNFMMQLDQALMSWIVFGEGCIKTERGTATQLVFQDYPAGHFVYLENSEQKIDTFMEKFKWTSRQCVEKWGLEGVGKTIRKAFEKPESRQNRFEIVHLVRPRKDRDPTKTIGGQPIQEHMAYEDLYIGCDDKVVIAEGGHLDFPYAIARYRKSSQEHRGRGVGTFIVPTARSCNAIKRDWIEGQNRRNRPPLEVVGDIQGVISLDPGALNYVPERQSINPIQGQGGDYAGTKDLLEMEREEIRKAFMLDTLNQLTQLKGDRRTTLEISERLNEGLRRLTQPIGRLIPEMLDPTINRVVLTMLRNDESLAPPPELEGSDFKVEYISPMMLALKRHQATAFQSWLEIIANVEQVFPGIKDNVDIDKGIRDLGDSLGIKAEHKRPKEQVDEMRAEQAEQQAQMMAMQQAEQAANAYSKGNQAPEPGSPAEGAMEGLA